MREEIKLTRKQVAPLIAASFPAYRGRTLRAEPGDSVTLSDLNWSGGSRSQYVFLELRTGRRADLSRLSQNAPWSQPMEGQRVALPPGVVCVEHVVSCGKDLGLRFTYNPIDAAQLVQPVPQIEVTRLTRAGK